jgi:SAM-dependent methyltransferase
MDRPDHGSLYDRPWLYDRVVAPGPCESFYRGLARQTGGPILELACGTGRLAVPLARDGHEVVGLDASRSMLQAAFAKTRDGSANLELIHGDMRNFRLGRRFALVVLSCNSLAHLTDNGDLDACISSIALHLASGGLFAFDVVNPNIPDLARPDLEIPDAGDGDDAGGRLVAYDPVRQVQLLRWSLAEPGKKRKLTTSMKLRTFFPQEVPPRLELAGLELVARYGDFAGGELTASSSNQVYVASPKE